MIDTVVFLDKYQYYIIALACLVALAQIVYEKFYNKGE